MCYIGRKCNNCGIENLKEELRKSGLFECLVGHANAFGVSINKYNIPIAIEFFNKKFKNIESVDYVDFVLEENIDYKVIKDIYSMSNLFTSSINEPKIVINNINIDMIGFQVFENEKTGNKRFVFNNGIIEYIMFNIKDDDYLINSFNENETINVIGKVTINTYGGKNTPQFIIDKYEVIK